MPAVGFWDGDCVVAAVEGWVGFGFGVEEVGWIRVGVLVWGWWWEVWDWDVAHRGCLFVC